jgi:hypothetical protein
VPLTPVANLPLVSGGKFANSISNTSSTGGKFIASVIDNPDELKPGTNPAAVATTQRQEEARREAGAEKLPEQGSPVEVQQALHQEEAARETGDEELPERGSPVEVRQALHQEEAARETGDEELPEQGRSRSGSRHERHSQGRRGAGGAR